MGLDGADRVGGEDPFHQVQQIGVERVLGGCGLGHHRVTTSHGW